MRIRKDYQSALPEGTVLNTLSTSQVNTYSCDYLNKKSNYLTYSREVILNGYFDSKPTTLSTGTYTFDDNGWLYIFATRGSTSGYTLKLNFDGIDRFNFPAYDPYAVVELMIPVTSGQTLKLLTDSQDETWIIRELRFLK